MAHRTAAGVGVTPEGSPSLRLPSALEASFLWYPGFPSPLLGVIPPGRLGLLLKQY